MTRKPAIQSVPLGPPDVYSFLRSVKGNLDLLTGVHGGMLTGLPPTATLAEVIAKVNEIIARINASGTA